MDLAEGPGGNNCAMVKSKPFSDGWFLTTLPPCNCGQYDFLFDRNMPQQALSKFGVWFHVNDARLLQQRFAAEHPICRDPPTDIDRALPAPQPPKSAQWRTISRSYQKDFEGEKLEYATGWRLMGPIVATNRTAFVKRPETRCNLDNVPFISRLIFSVFGAAGEGLFFLLYQIYADVKSHDGRR